MPSCFRQVVLDVRSASVKLCYRSDLLQDYICGAAHDVLVVALAPAHDGPRALALNVVHHADGIVVLGVLATHVVHADDREPSVMCSSRAPWGLACRWGTNSGVAGEAVNVAQILPERVCTPWL